METVDETAVHVGSHPPLPWRRRRSRRRALLPPAGARDQPEAALWLSRAAQLAAGAAEAAPSAPWWGPDERGPAAKTLLAVCLLEARGVPPDPESGAVLLREARPLPRIVAHHSQQPSVFFVARGGCQAAAASAAPFA